MTPGYNKLYYKYKQPTEEGLTIFENKIGQTYSRVTPGRKEYMKIVMAFTLSQGVVTWLNEKKKQSVNISAFVNKALEDMRIKEIEEDEDS